MHYLSYKTYCFQTLFHFTQLNPGGKKILGVSHISFLFMLTTHMWKNRNSFKMTFFI